jgi:hypothetical protein
VIAPQYGLGVHGWSEQQVADDDDRCGQVEQPVDHGHGRGAGGPAVDEQVQDRDGGRDDQDDPGGLPEAGVCLGRLRRALPGAT